MAEQNIALNRPAAASSFVKPYEPAKAVNGATTQFSRWLCNTLPGWMSVDLGVNGSYPYWINRWVVRHMSVAGWASPDYNMCDFKIQGSNDNNTWYDIDSVVGNTVGITDRTFAAVGYRYVRLYVTKGLKCNTQLASAMEFEVYQSPPLSAYLQSNIGLSVSGVTLNPTPFMNNVLNYTASSVVNSVTSVAVKPTSEDPRAVIKVNGAVVTSGNSSNVPLNVGSNTISIQVTAVDGRTTNTYTVSVVRDVSSGPCLTNLTANVVGGDQITLLQNIVDTNILVYTGAIEYSNSTFGIQSVAVTPTAGSNTVIKYLGNEIPSGVPVTINNLAVGDNDINFDVAAPDGTGGKTYTIRITRKHSTYLSGITTSKGTITPTAVTKASPYSYTIRAGSMAPSTTITLTAEDASAGVTTIALSVDASTYTSTNGVLSQLVSVSSTAKTATVTVTSTSGIPATVYTLLLSK